MNMDISADAVILGKKAAKLTAETLNEAIAVNGSARLLLSTGKSQFETLDSLLREDVDWTKVELFHLDEYIGLPESHMASFRKYLKERFISKLTIKDVYLIDGEADVEATISTLNEKIRERPVDVGLIGIGENAHIAFNDPPADFTTKKPFIVVDLNSECKQQQLNEGWFGSIDEVPNQAISMSVWQIMQCRRIVSAVPHAVKARAIKATIEQQVSENVPATILKKHADWHLFLDSNSASLLDN